MMSKDQKARDKISINEIALRYIKLLNITLECTSLMEHNPISLVSMVVRARRNYKQVHGSSLLVLSICKWCMNMIIRAWIRIRRGESEDKISFVRRKKFTRWRIGAWRCWTWRSRKSWRRKSPYFHSSQGYPSLCKTLIQKKFREKWNKSMMAPQCWSRTELPIFGWNESKNEKIGSGKEKGVVWVVEREKVKSDLREKRTMNLVFDCVGGGSVLVFGIVSVGVQNLKGSVCGSMNVQSTRGRYFYGACG